MQITFCNWFKVDKKVKMLCINDIFFIPLSAELKKTRERDLSIAENRQGLFSGGLPRKPLV